MVKNIDDQNVHAYFGSSNRQNPRRTEIIDIHFDLLWCDRNFVKQA